MSDDEYKKNLYLAALAQMVRTRSLSLQIEYDFGVRWSYRDDATVEVGLYH